MNVKLMVLVALRELHYKLIVVIMIAYNPNLQVIVKLAWLLCSQHSFRLLKYC